MIEQQTLLQSLSHTLESTDYQGIGQRYQGKVRDCYSHNDRMFLVTTDRLSAFDKVLSTIPYKGQVLTALAAHWFEQTKDIAPNHLLEQIDPNVLVTRSCKIIPIEVVVRAYLTGSAWRDYCAGKAVSGIQLPSGLQHGAKFDSSIVTPSTKASLGEHDLPISEEDILSSKLVEAELWNQIKESAFALFGYASEVLQKRGLLLVDTKFEFGICEQQLLVADEIFTLDSSRIWLASSYKDRFERGEPFEMLDKEPIRQWLLERGYKGDGQPPEIDQEHRCFLAQHYINAFQQITGKEFEPVLGDANQRINDRIFNYLSSLRSDL